MDSGITRSTSVKVVVVGAGGAGLSAAIAAAEAGASVTVLEKGSKIGGTTALSIGSITAAGTRLQKLAGVEDSASEHFEDMTVLAGKLLERDNLNLRRILTQNAADTVHWLESLGVTFVGPFNESPHRAPRMHVALPNARAFIFFLERRCRALGVKVVTNAPIERLLTGGNGITGVLARVNGEAQQFDAGSVVLTTGDYSAAQDLKARFLPVARDVDPINPLSTGDGHRVAMSLGAYVRNGDLAAGPKFRFKPPSWARWITELPPFGIVTGSMRFAFKRLPSSLLRPFLLPTLTSYLAPELSLFTNGAILVNSEGKRFTNERGTPANDLSRQPGKAAYIVMDDRLARKFSRWPYYVSTAPGIAYAYLQDYARIRKDVYTRASTIEELSAKLALPPDSLKQTVAAYNAAFREGGSAEAQPLSIGPFHALGPVYSWVVVTQGGLAVSDRHEVIREDGSWIEGLYAAGNAGLGGLLMAGHGHYLGWAFTSGRLAGGNAAHSAARSRRMH